MSKYANNNKYTWTCDVRGSAADNDVLSSFVIPANREATIFEVKYALAVQDVGVALEVELGGSVLAEVSIAGSAGVNEPSSFSAIDIASSTSDQILIVRAKGTVDTGVGSLNVKLAY